MSAHSSKRAPVYASLVDETGEELGTTANPLTVTTTGGGTGGAEEVEVTSWTATQTVKVEQTGALPAGTNNIGGIEIVSGNGSNLKAEVANYANVATWTTADNSLAVAALLGAHNGSDIERLSSTSGALNTNVQTLPAAQLATTGAVKTYNNNPSTLVVSRAALTNVDTPFSYTAGTSVLLQSDPDNTVNIVFGGSSSTKYMTLIPGQSMYYPFNVLHVATVTGTANLNMQVMQP